MKLPARTQVAVVGSGAGGAVTALELAKAGHEVCVFEEGNRLGLSDYGLPLPLAMKRLYRRTGMTPIRGGVPIGYVEGSCVGGSTEINSGFWQRTTAPVLDDWKDRFGLVGASEEDLAPHYQWSEELLHVSVRARPFPPSTEVFIRGAENAGMTAIPIQRVEKGCRNLNLCASGCPEGRKQGMSVSLLPEAEKAGVRIFSRCHVTKIEMEGDRVKSLLVKARNDTGGHETSRVAADVVFVCAGPTASPALLLQSGFKHNTGKSLGTHPMLKVAARFDTEINAHKSVLPLVQVKDLEDITLGGSLFTPGHLALVLSENGQVSPRLMKQYKQMALYYVAVKGSGTGSVSVCRSEKGVPRIYYRLSKGDLAMLGHGLAKLCEILFRAGAVEVIPAIYGATPLKKEKEGLVFAKRPPDKHRLGLTTVHAFSTCPSGENKDLCATDSFGKVQGTQNLYVNDASIMPTSPGVNPQGTVMALARRNVRAYMEKEK